MAEIHMTEEGSTPSTPSSGKWKIYFKSTGLYIIDDAGIETFIAPAPIPGGRLTLISGTPVTTSDVATSTSVYYTPYIHNHIQLWDGGRWVTVTYTEKTLAIGTVTSGLPYDVFGYLSSGTLALEKLAWTNSTTRATSVSLQDGRYCKTGDKTRLYLGTFYSISTTQTTDSKTQRYLWNMYNRVNRELLISNSTSHNYNVATVRAFNNDQANSDFEWFAGLLEDKVIVNLSGQITRISTDGNPRISLGINSTTTETGAITGLAHTVVGRIRGGGSASITPQLGYNYACGLEFSTVGTAPGATFEAVELSAVVRG